MSWLRSRTLARAHTPPPASDLSEEEALRIATKAYEDGDWPTALIALDRVKAKKSASPAYQAMHGWALMSAGRWSSAEAALARASDGESAERLAIVKRQRAASPLTREWSAFKLDGLPLALAPEDTMAITQLVMEAKPTLVLEFGSHGGGAAAWLATLTHCEVHTADWLRVRKPLPELVTAWTGDLRKPWSLWPSQLRERIVSERTLIVLHAVGGYDIASSLLRALHPWAGRECTLIALRSDHAGQRSAADALDKLQLQHPTMYADAPSGSVNVRALRRTTFASIDVGTLPSLAELNALKASRKQQRDLDFHRALQFHAQGDLSSACEAAKEELRFYPDHAAAAALRDTLMAHLFPEAALPADEDFRAIRQVVRGYTMLSDARLYSLYLRARMACALDVPGDFVECGVAAGGSAALLAAVVARYSQRPRRVFCCDTFEGMPAPTAHDRHGDIGAEASGWGAGTCAAPEASLLDVAWRLGVTEFIEPVKGLFATTLPTLRNELREGIALLHLDGDWHDSTFDALTYLFDLLRKSGVMQVDDYGYWSGCREAVHRFADQHDLSFGFQAIDGTGVWCWKPGSAPMINIGCGAHWHSQWLNLDLVPTAPQVLAYDVTRAPLPFPEQSCGAVYHSHVLEHLHPEQAREFIHECHRVLIKGGVLRVVVPDLEGIVRLYMDRLDAAAAGQPGAAAEHDWMIHELVDQLTRERSGGAMVDWWLRDPMPARNFIRQRMGWEIDTARSLAAQRPAAPTTAQGIGSFRQSGEVHHWMWDRVSLARLLTDAGFTDVRGGTASESRISSFADFQLDADAAGRVRKPDSLFLEAVRG